MKKLNPRLLGYLTVLLILTLIAKLTPYSISNAGLELFLFGPVIYLMEDAGFLAFLKALLLPTALILPWCFWQNLLTRVLFTLAILIWPLFLIGAGFS